MSRRIDLQETSLGVATVTRFTKGKRRLKKARGFSLGELSQVGLQPSQARSLRIRVDPRRSTIHAQNVSVLKAFVEQSAPKMGTSQPQAQNVAASEPETDSAQSKKSRRHKSSPAKE